MTTTVAGGVDVADQRPSSDRWWRWYLGAGIVALALFLVAPGTLWRDLIYLLVGVSSVVALGYRTAVQPAHHKTPWRLMMIGQLFWVIGDTAQSWFEDVIHSPYLFPSPADVVYLAAYPLLGMGLVLLIRGRLPRRDVGSLLDCGILTVGLGLVSWVVLARPALDASRLSWIASAVTIAYPAADIVLAGLLIRLVAMPGGRTPAFRWLVSAIVFVIAADSVYSFLSLRVSTDSHVLELGWLASYLAWGIAGLHPSSRQLSDPTAGTEGRFTGLRLIALTLAILVAPATLGIEALLGLRTDVWAIVIGSAVLFLLVVGRMQSAIHLITASNRARDALQADLAYQAAHDALTGLPNRAHAMHEIEASLNRAQRTSALLGLLFIDLDKFKAANDTFGHYAGDQVLHAVARRLQDAVRAGDMVARLGGDEFVVLLETLNDESDALHIANRIVESLAEPIPISGGHRVRIGASVGMAVGQDGSTDAQRLLHEADTASYRAKEAGRGRVEVFDQTVRQELAERANLEVAITDAISNNELVVHYQPITELRTGTVRGYEALIRWQQPGGLLVPPDDFISTAEATDLICDLGTWVLRQATGQLAGWTTAGMPRRTVAVNISGRHICAQRIVDDVTSALSGSGLDPTQLVLEVTETVLMDSVLAISNLHQLQDLGVAISIDDFGTGYNSITRLKHLPIDIIKIDRTFLDGSDKSASALLELIVHTAHTFGLPVVAEGVETAAQLDVLRGLECDYVQGYFLARPLTVEQIGEFSTTTVSIRDALSALTTGPEG